MNVQDIILLAIQLLNLVITVSFLALFFYRYVMLRTLSRTQRFTNYWPKFRILLSLFYIGLSIAVLCYNLVQNIYVNSQWYEYILQGGGGECINSIIILLQLFVLRLQLNRQQPYTAYHVRYFLYLMIISIVRLVFTLVIHSINNVFNIVFASIMTVDSLMQFIYWVIKRQSLPQFLQTNHIQIDKINQDNIRARPQPSQKSYLMLNDPQFPFIIPFVSVDNSKIKIILQSSQLARNKSQSHRQSDPSGLINQLNKTPLLIPTMSMASKNNVKIISAGYYSYSQIKQFYVSCNRFPIKTQLYFDSINLQQMSKRLQQFLQELFRDRRWYQPNILKYLKLSQQQLSLYRRLMQTNITNNQSEFDQTIGLRHNQDKNSLFISIFIYKFLWMSDHYQFYIKASANLKSPSYPIKRYSEFQDNHITLKQIIKTLGLHLLLPQLPKKHLLHWNEDEQTGQRKHSLQKYLRRLCNDETLMEVSEIRNKILQFLGIDELVLEQNRECKDFYTGLQIKKGEISKALNKNEYKWNLNKKDNQEIQLIFLASLGISYIIQQVNRWMNNVQITYKLINLPQKILFKSQANRHQKLKIYLQHLLEIKQVRKIYAVNSFFNAAGADDVQQQISTILNMTMSKPKRSRLNSNVLDQVIELQESPNIRESQSDQSSRRFSRIIEDLGNTNYD